ncbi:MAG: adenylate/guanylate cyclase domain-containing protein [Bacteroidota bacterium]
MRLKQMKGIVLCVGLLTTWYANGQKEGDKRIDSLLQELPKAIEDTNKVRLLNDLSFTYHNINPYEGLKYGEQCLTLATKINWKEGIAIGNSCIGANYHRKSEYLKALEYEFNAMTIYQSLDMKTGIASESINVGNVYSDQGNHAKALEYYIKALTIYEQTGNKRSIASVDINIGNVYNDEGNYNRALSYYQKAFDANQSLGYEKGIADNEVNIGNVYNNQSKYADALSYYLKALKSMEHLGDKNSIAIIIGNIGNVYNNESNYAKALEYYNKAQKINEELENKKGIAVLLGQIGSAYLGMAGDPKSKVTIRRPVALHKAIDYFNKAIEQDKSIGSLKYIQLNYKQLSIAQEMLGDNKAALNSYKQYVFWKDSVFSQRNSEKIANIIAQRKIDVMDKELMIQKLEVDKKRNERIFFIIGLGLLLAVILVIAKERKKSELLLLNILPEKIAARLKNKEHPIADKFEAASIIFIDIANFTGFSEKRDPKETVDMLNDIFTRFDMLAEKHGLEKIKTIGDCYMAVCGIPEPHAGHSDATALMALDVKRTMGKYKSLDGTPILFRIGLDCGPVVAGVIGKKKFIYDLWGDPVNSASRMEGSGVAGEVHCSDRFKNSLKGTYTFVSRGELEIKGKGMMRTWLLHAS